MKTTKFSKLIFKNKHFYSKKIALLPADGIGKDVVASAEQILRKFTDFSFVTLDIGFECFQKHGNALPDSTIEGLKNCDGAIFGVREKKKFKFFFRFIGSFITFS